MFVVQKHLYCLTCSFFYCFIIDTVKGHVLVTLIRLPKLLMHGISFKLVTQIYEKGEYKKNISALALAHFFLLVYIYF